MKVATERSRDAQEKAGRAPHLLETPRGVMEPASSHTDNLGPESPTEEVKERQPIPLPRGSCARERQWFRSRLPEFKPQPCQSLAV